MIDPRTGSIQEDPVISLIISDKVFTFSRIIPICVGENMVTWSQIDANAFPELITEFLSLHPSLDTPEKGPPR